MIANAVANADESALAVIPDGFLNSLIGTETSAIAMDARAPTDRAVKVIDAANPSNNKVVKITDVLGTIWTEPRLCVQADMRTLRWSPHNMAKQSNNPGANISGITQVAAADSDGGMTAATGTVTSTVLAAFHQVAISGSAYAGQWHTESWIVKAGTGPFIYLAFNDGTYHHVWFNTATWAIATTDAGVTGALISNFRADGTLLPTGYKRIQASYQMPGNSITITCGVSNADATKNATVGHTFTVEKPHLHLGVNTIPYYENTTAVIAVGIPITYAQTGKPQWPIEAPATTINSRWSEDLTNAAWVKTNCTALFNQTGPAGEPCSLLTATGANATCLQAVVSAGTAQIFTPWIKRSVGTGPVSITNDNGATWKVVTISSAFFTPCYATGVANPTLGFKIDANADAIIVAYAANAAYPVVTTPKSVFGANVTKSADTFAVPVTALTPSTAYTGYVDIMRRNGAYSGDGSIRLGNTAATQTIQVSVSVANGFVTMNSKDGVNTKNYPFYQLGDGEHLEVTTRLKANENLMSINGEVPATDGRIVNVPTVNSLSLGGGSNGAMLLSRLLFVNRAVDKDSVHTWRYSSGTHNHVVDSKVVAWDSDPEFANTTMNRSPALCKLSDDGVEADYIVTWGQKHDTGFHPEAPARIMARKYRANKIAGTIVPISEGYVLYQPSGWLTGTGQAQAANLIKIPYGPFKGQLVAVLTINDNPTFTPDKRSVYVMFNDDDGNPSRWTVPYRIFEALSGEYALVEPSGSMIMLPQTHPIAPNRIIVPVTVSGGAFRLMWSNYWGQPGTWYISAPNSPPGVTVDETNISFHPDGTVVVTMRVTGGAPVTDRYWATSTDAGATLTYQGALPGASMPAISVGLLQSDPTATVGAYGKFIMSRPTRVDNLRYGSCLEFATDAAMTFGNRISLYQAQSNTRYLGYSSVEDAFFGSHVVVALEGGSVPFNVDNSVFIHLVELP
jgi:hypothetical protein